MDFKRFNLEILKDSIQKFCITVFLIRTTTKPFKLFQSIWMFLQKEKRYLFGAKYSIRTKTAHHFCFHKNIFDHIWDKNVIYVCVIRIYLLFIVRNKNKLNYFHQHNYFHLDKIDSALSIIGFTPQIILIFLITFSCNFRKNRTFFPCQSFPDGTRH